MEWLRMYHEARADKKLASLNDAQFRVWFNLLLYAGEQEVRGTVPMPDDELLALEVAVADTDLLHATLDRLVRLRILSPVDGGFAFCQWEKRQPNSDSSTERVRKHRERKRNGDETVTETVTKRSGNGGVTVGNALEQNREEQSRGDQRETGASEPAPPSAGATPPDQPGDGKPKRDKPPPSPEAIALAARLARLIAVDNPKAVVKAGQPARWAEQFDTQHRVDRTSWDDMQAALEWAHRDDFWRSNVLSAEALRRHWNRLTEQMQRGVQGHGGPTRRTGAFGAGTGPGGTSVYDRFVQRDDGSDDDDVPEVRAGPARAAT